MKKQERYVFPAICTYYDDGDIAITFPDLPGCVSQTNIEQRVPHMANEVLSLHLFGIEEDGDEIPAPTPLLDVELEDKEKERVILVEVYMPAIRHSQENNTVRRTVTLPAWLNFAALRENINFSHVLQKALVRDFGFERPAKRA